MDIKIYNPPKFLLVVFYAAAMIMAGALSVTPVPPSVLTYFTNLRNYVRLSRRRPLSNSNNFHQNFMELGHILSSIMSSLRTIMVHIAPGF